MRLGSGVYKITVGASGSGYTAPPSVTLSGGGGTGASAVAQMAGTNVQAVLVTNAGTGYTAAPSVSFAGGGGTGASADASVLSYAGTNVISIFKGRGNDVYGVDGHGRGFRWDGDTGYLEPLGISRPTAAPTVSATTAASSGSIRSVAIVNGGAGYSSPPSVTFIGGGLTDGSTLHAKARAKVANARVVGVTMDSRGGHYSSAPQIVFSGGVAGGAQLKAIAYGCVTAAQVVSPGSGYWLGSVTTGLWAPTCVIGGGVGGVTLTSGGTGYTSPPTVTFDSVNGGAAQGVCELAGTAVGTIRITKPWAGYSSAPSVTISGGGGSGASAQCFLDGLTGAEGIVLVDDFGCVAGLSITNAGTGAIATPGISVHARSNAGTYRGSGAELMAVPSYTISGVTIISGGTDYVAPPAIGFRPISGDAWAVAGVSNGSVVAVTMLAEGRYDQIPTVLTEATTATAIATVTQPATGKYKCCMRYVDDTAASRGGPIPSSISEMTDVESLADGSALLWKWSNNGAEARAHKLELWRTTSDQAIVLYRVAVLEKTAGAFPTSYEDALSDNDLLDATRDDFGLMPIVMPTGQLNARRFDPPKESCSLACVFQDRAWYSGDTTGEKPNSLWHSEVDEPESAPEVYELVVQENTQDSDAIRALVPFGSVLLIFQSRHLYKLQYVSQPIIDGNMTLAAYRGVINERCVDVYDGVAFAADYAGLYAFDGSNIDTISVAVDDYWRTAKIDFQKSKAFHLRVNPADRVVRFYYIQQGEAADYPARALCYCLSTKTWWEETYPTPHSSTVPAISGKRVTLLTGTTGTFVKQTPGVTDEGDVAIPYDYRSGPFPVTNEPSRSVGILYTPSANTLGVRVHYNGSAAARTNAVATSRGDGFTSAQGSTETVLDMRPDRSALGPATGYARAMISGRADDRSSGGDKHLAIAVGGAKTGAAPVTIHTVTIEGVTS